METSVPDMIMKKRDGLELSDAEIEHFIQAVISGVVQECQVGAMLMAMYLKDLSIKETTCLTRAMMNSGEILQWPEKWAGLLVDKHSTGGVGDKVSLILAPALAACGMKVPMISGRGLGHTGGTLDKLESIPGYQVSVTTEKMLEILDTVGCCIVGQTKSLCPADKVLYATRDVTGTVSHSGLIAASIVSKKAAENVDALILDVKFGSGAFITDKDKARTLAEVLVASSRGLGIKTAALLTDMNAPLGNMVGNALEVIEAIHCLHNKGPEDLTSMVDHLGGHLLASAGKAESPEAGYNMIKEKIENGSALAKFCAMMKGQGVAPKTADQLCQPDNNIEYILPHASHTTDFKCTESGYVTEINARVCAVVAQKLGAGRTKAGEPIDYAVGLELLASCGDKISKGSPWVKVHHTGDIPTDVASYLETALVVQANKPKSNSNRVLDVIG